MIRARKRGHSVKPCEIYEIAETCSYPPRLEMFARERRRGWDAWGNELPDTVDPFVMVWDNRRDIPELRRFARWVNKRIYKREPDFQNYDPGIGHGRERESFEG